MGLEKRLCFGGPCAIRPNGPSRHQGSKRLGAVIAKEVSIGFITGLISNGLGLLVCTAIVAKLQGGGIEQTLRFYIETGNLWMLITLGALPNLLAFFGFLKLKRDYRARGVLLATFVAAIAAYLIYFI